ncbi:MAG: DUF559 domain-containing protein [Acidimicrobiia bacterium]|jgi:hypothetical protein
MWNDGLVRHVAGVRHGVVSRLELQDLSVTDREIRRKVEAGRIEAVHPGVYYVDSVPATWRTMVAAAVLAAGPRALASHRCAGVLYDLDAVYGRMIELTVPYNGQPDPEGVIVHRTRRLNPPAVLDGIAVTTAPKTILDLAACLPERVLQKAARSAVSQGLTTIDILDRTVGQHGGRGVRGTRATRRVLRLVADDMSGSVAEIDLKHIVLDAPIPSPIQQLRVRLPSGSNAYPDFAWPDRMRIVEVDGFEAHNTPEQLQHDLRRQNELMGLGWEIRRFTATEVREESQRVRTELVAFVSKPFCEG